MSPASNRDQRLVLGGTPYADLLPPEIKQDKVAARQRSNLIAVFVLIIFLVGLASGAATLFSLSAAASLAEAQGRSDALLAEQAKYSEVREVQGQLAAANASLALASEIEIDWNAFITDFLASMPVGTSLESVTANLVTSGSGASPIYQQSSVEIVTAVTTPNLLTTSQWLAQLKSLPGFLDVQPSSAVLSGDGYSVSLTIHLGPDALWARYATPADGTTATPTPTPTPTTSPDPVPTEATPSPTPTEELGQ